MPVDPSGYVTWDYAFVLELANGFAFVLSLVLALTLLAILILRVKDRKHFADYVVQLTSGMILVKLGLALGFGYRWLIARCQNSLEGDCSFLKDDFWILFISVAMIAVGGLIILHVISRPQWRPWSWLVAGVVSIVVPFIYYSFNLMFPLKATHGTIVHGSYAWDRVSLSILVACFGSYVALDLAHRAGKTSGIRKAIWVAAAGGLLGGSIWSMHFIAMLAFELPGVDVTYDPGLTLLSLALPIAFTLIGIFAAVNAPNPGWVTLSLSAALIAFGVTAMHYIGMAAMEMAAEVSYDPVWVMVSILIAIIASYVAVMLVFQETTLLQRIIAGCVLGAFGISGLHYSAMVAFTCRVTDASGNVIVTRPLGGFTQMQLAFGIAAVTFVILGVFLMLSIYDRAIEERRR